MQEDFYMMLLSNSSMRYFPENKSTHFVTKLPRHVHLEGQWAVSLIDIHVPLNFQNVSKEEKNRCMSYARAGRLSDDEIDTKFFLHPGLYKDMEELLDELNTRTHDSHVEFYLKPGFFVGVRKKCGNDVCNASKHRFRLSQSLGKILGFEPSTTAHSMFVDDGEVLSDFPANLNANLPTSLLVYTDICQPFILGDVYAKLLRIVPLDLSHYTYGRTLSVNFSRSVYVPLMCSNFETIEILIRSEIGEKVSLDYGTVTITLHFKRIL